MPFLRAGSRHAVRDHVIAALLPHCPQVQEVLHHQAQQLPAPRAELLLQLPVRQLRRLRAAQPLLHLLIAGPGLGERTSRRILCVPWHRAPSSSFRTSASQERSRKEPFKHETTRPDQASHTTHVANGRPELTPAEPHPSPTAPPSCAGRSPGRGKHPRVVLEATHGWYWAADTLAAAGAKVHLAHPLGVRGFRYRRVKNDEKDAADLADLLRLGRLPQAWIAPAEIRELRELTRYRHLCRHRHRCRYAEARIMPGSRPVCGWRVVPGRETSA